MDNNKSGISLKMIDLYFSEINFKNNKIIGKTKLEINHKITQSFSEENINCVTIEISTSILSDNGSIELFIKTIGIFELLDETLDDVTKDILFSRNTVAIMFPFIRSQVSLITTQPGLQPIMMQPINVNSLYEDKK